MLGSLRRFTTWADGTTRGLRGKTHMQCEVVDWGVTKAIGGHTCCENAGRGVLFKMGGVLFVVMVDASGLMHGSFRS
jgi:hypothetical protein